MTTTIQIGMAIILFITGIGMLICGLVIIMTREYQEAMRSLAGQSSRLSSKSLMDIGVQSALDGAAHLLEAITRLVQTAIGTGAFLCLLGTILCGLAFWMMMMIGA
ncbi:hypothetical protein [Roseiflexus sp.]|uniref:hypothetical protein n=1 Tax=Roseiflexus sp. TaxID=2562120 RepID=UPI00398AD192